MFVALAPSYRTLTCHIVSKTLSHVNYFNILGEVKLTYVVSTTRCIYTCPVWSGTPRPPPEVVLSDQVYICLQCVSEGIYTWSFQDQIRIKCMKWPGVNSPLERQSLSEIKLGRGSPICERVCKKIVTLKTMFFNVKVQRLCKSHHLQCITSSNDVRETGEITMQGTGRRPLVDARGLRAPRRHWITHRHDSFIDITKWAQEYFQKPLS